MQKIRLEIGIDCKDCQGFVDDNNDGIYNNIKRHVFRFNSLMLIIFSTKNPIPMTKTTVKSHLHAINLNPKNSISTNY